MDHKVQQERKAMWVPPVLKVQQARRDPQVLKAPRELPVR
jgi:hypothetical protein